MKKNIEHLNIEPELVRNSLSRILTSTLFKASPKIKKLLIYLVESRLSGVIQLKSYTVGVEVFNRAPNYDPQIDSIVRTTSVRLRKLLDAYYADEGRDESIRIVLDKGSYLPTFVYSAVCKPEVRKGGDRILLIVERLKLIGETSDLEYLSIGLTEELTGKLAAYGDELIAVSAEDAAHTQPRIASSPAIPGLVSYILRGMLRASGNEIRINFQLIEGKSGVVNWSEVFSARLTSSNLFDIQTKVANRVASTLLDPHGVLYRSLKRNPAVLLGTKLAVFRYHEYQEHFLPNKHLTARNALENAVLEESDYACAWAALANVYLGEALFGFNRTDSPSCLIEKIVGTAQKAIALDPRHVMANYILAMALFYRKDKPQFLVMADHALDLAPFRPDNLAVIGMHLMLAGEWERGLGLVEKAMALNPYHPNWHYLVHSLYHLHGRNPIKALGSIGRFASIDFFPFQIHLAVIHGFLGNSREARQCLARMYNLWPSADRDMNDILDFWFPFENLAEVFLEGLAKAGFSIRC